MEDEALNDLFSSEGADRLAQSSPLADRLRPKSLAEVIGQGHLLDSGRPLERMMAAQRLSSVIFWGPPGTGKTTIARLLGQASGYHFEKVSAIFSGVADLRKVFDLARVRRAQGRATVLFVDEIHRFNRAQQDSFLPVMEDGTIVLVGATTENPSFELNPALLSRAQVLTLNRLSSEDLELLLQRAEELCGRSLPLASGARQSLKLMADGDGRYILNLADEILSLTPVEPLSVSQLSQFLQRRAPLYDKGREGHFNLISALHKSVRGSDPDAALYWLARMLGGGEDPSYIGRRIVRMAVEDIGLADPRGLTLALAAKDAFEFLGAPEGELAIAQAVVFLACAPKSNSVYRAFCDAQKLARETGSLNPPPHILNAPTKLMKDIGYGRGYVYDHDTKSGFSGQNYFPEEIDPPVMYSPGDAGLEREIGARLESWRAQRLSNATK